MDALNNNEKSYALILDIISRKASGRLDTALHMSAYVLNPYYLYNDLEVQKDDDLNDAIVELVETLFGEDYNMQNQITLHEFPMYKGKLEKFGRTVAIKGCEVNDEKYDPALWWSMYGGSTPNLKKIAMRILSLTISSSGCERNWSTFEGNKRRKARDHEVLLAQEAGEAQEWIVEGEVYEDGVEAGLTRETVSDDIGVLQMVPEPRIMPPRRFKNKSIRKIVEKRVAKAIEKYEKTRADSNNTGGSGSTNTGGTVVPEMHGCSYKTFMNGKPHSFKGTEGVVGLKCWFEKMEQVFEICKCAEDDKVKFAMCTFEGRALTWWNGNVQTMGLANANQIP
ncbi:reverse transcriptase domain-containing protein [Tanacetum coccineum]